MIFEFKNIQVIWPQSDWHNKRVHFSINTDTGEVFTADFPTPSRIFEGDHLFIAPGFCELNAQLREPGMENAETIARLALTDQPSGTHSSERMMS